MRTLIICLLATAFGYTSNAQNQQDTLTFLHYNLLYYGATSSQCTASNNPIAAKDGYLKKILKYAQPDVFTVNEMGCNNVYIKRILQNCLNTDGVTKYAGATLQNKGGQDICNALFYNSEKLGIISSNKITTGKTGISFIRAIDLHELFVKGQYTSKGDSIKFTQLIAHLKAGSTSANASEREYAAEGVMDYLENNHDTGNFILSGDLNVYRSSEGAYGHFTNYSNSSYNFIDPINKPGSWNNNSAFAQYHTQSTHTSGSCFSGGGMDDRFDFVLSSSSAMNNSSRMEIIPSSYRAVGQDGNRFNGNLINPANTDVPSDIAQALYDMSDHLPVLVKAAVSIPDVSAVSYAEKPYVQLTPMSAPKGLVRFQSNVTENGFYQVRVYSIDGTLTNQKEIEFRAGKHVHEFVVNDAGIYLVETSDRNGKRTVIKIVSC